MNYIENEKQVELDIKKIYIMPKFKIVSIKGVFLVISYETGNWIVLYNNIQKYIFEYLSNKYSIEDTMREFEEYTDDIFAVLIQLEAKNFTNTNVQKIENGETMQIYITNGCNLRCKHCYMYADYKRKNELTFEEIKNICINFKANGGKYITLTGGEVTTRKDFSDIIQLLHQLKLGIHILSNGVSWSSDLINLVAKCNVQRVQISLDGYDEKSNSLVRGKDVFQMSLETIDNLVRKGVNVTVAVTPLFDLVVKNKQNYINFAKELIEKYRKYKFSVNFSFELIEGRNLPKSDIIKHNKKYMMIMDEINSTVYPNSEIESFIENHKDNKIFNNCGYGRINVAPNGDIFFCSRITEVKKYANIRENSFEDIFSKVKLIRNLSDINNLKPCNKCELKYICGGGCRVNEFYELTQIDKLSDISDAPTISRKCTEESKNRLYELMIECNERLFR